MELLRKDFLGKGPFKSVHEMIGGNHLRTILTRDEGTELWNNGGHGGEGPHSPHSLNMELGYVEDKK